MGVHIDDTKKKEQQKRIKESVAIYERDKQILAAEVTDAMRQVDLKKIREKLESAKSNGLSSDWYVRIDRAIQEFNNWFNLKK